MTTKSVKTIAPNHLHAANSCSKTVHVGRHSEKAFSPEQREWGSEESLFSTNHELRTTNFFKFRAFLQDKQDSGTTDFADCTEIIKGEGRSETLEVRDSSPSASSGSE